MFPLNVKSHQMELRNEEIFNVNHANTERYMKSSISYMQRLMNKETQDKESQKVTEIQTECQDDL